MTKKPPDPPDPDKEKIEKTIKFITSRMTAGDPAKLQSAIEIGTHILEEYFGGNPLAFSSKRPESPSFRKLASRPELAELGLKPSSLRYRVKVSIQDRRWQAHIKKGRLPPEVSKLGYTKRTKLTHAQPRDEIRIAKEAIQKNLTAAQIEERVTAANAKKRGKGASKAPSVFARHLVMLIKAIKALLAADLKAVDGDDLHNAHHVIKGTSGHLQSILDALMAEVAVRPQDPNFNPDSHVDPDALDDLPLEPIDNPQKGVKKGKKKEKSAGRPRIYVIVGKEKKLPDSEGMDELEAMIDGRYDWKEEVRCALWAKNEEDAITQYTTVLGDRAPDLKWPEREVIAVHLWKRMKRIRREGKLVSMQDYFSLDIEMRCSTLEELQEELSR